MSNRENGPDLDYYELRRRHQEYKSRMRTQPSEPEAKPAPAPAPEEPLRADEIQDAPVDIPADIPAEEPAEQDPLASFVLSDEEPYEDELDYGDEPKDDASNPFNSFIRFFHGVKDNISARREAQEAAELDALDADLTDEELAALGEEFDGLEQTDGDARAEDMGEGFEDAGEQAPRKSGLQRFVGLFVTRVEDEEPEDYEELEEFVSDYDEEEAFAADISEDAAVYSAHSEPEGGQTMDEMNKLISETAPQMAEGLETSGMSRRERRERAMRLAAEEAARKAAEEAQSDASEPAAESLFAQEEPAPAESEPDEELLVDEPTREFTPVSLRAAEEEKQDLFDVGDEDDDEDEDDD